VRPSAPSRTSTGASRSRLSTCRSTKFALLPASPIFSSLTLASPLLPVAYRAASTRLEDPTCQRGRSRGARQDPRPGLHPSPASGVLGDGFGRQVQHRSTLEAQLEGLPEGEGSLFLLVFLFFEAHLHLLAGRSRRRPLSTRSRQHHRRRRSQAC
jgi:hypothetical protein